MYLSRLIINPRSRAACKDIAYPYEMHRSITSAFPKKEDGGCGRILWRIDHNHREDRYAVYVQSEKKPDWSKLLSKAYHGDYLDDTCEQNPAGPREIDDEFHFAPGKRLSFRLRANPTKKIGTVSKAERLAGKKGNGKRIPLQKPQEQIEWLQRKGLLGGFVPHEVNITQPNRDTANQKKDDQGNRNKITIQSVRFDGILEVTDSNKFYETLSGGIGPGKGLGMGLLSIAPS